MTQRNDQSAAEAKAKVEKRGQILKKIEEKFGVLEELTRGIAENKLRCLLVCGDPGIGKSHCVNETLSQYSDSSSAFFNDLRVTWQKGHITPLEIFNMLGRHRSEKDVIIFDDSDSCFQNTSCLNILKAATDTKSTREITWASTTGKAEFDSYVFDGRIVILTNANHVGGAHITAFLDRVITLKMYFSDEERLVRISEIAKQHKFIPAETINQIIDWIEEHYQNLANRVSVRTFIKITELMYSRHWQTLAQHVLLERR